MTYTIAAIIVYVLVGVYTYGRALAFWSREYPLAHVNHRWGDVATSIAQGILWPVGLPWQLTRRSNQGLKFIPPRPDPRHTPERRIRL